MHSMLQRVRELAVQVSNGIYDPTDRKAVQDEVSQLLSEVQRISDDIEFNETKLLNGDLDRRAFSTNSGIADIVSMSDTVEAGNYTFEVTTAATKSTVKSKPAVASPAGSALFDSSSKSQVGGTININGEQVKIEVGDTSEQVYAKLRNLASTVDINLVSSATPYANGAELTLTHNQFGDEAMNITGDIGLLTAMGLATPASSTIGKDAVIKSSDLTVANGWPAGTTYSSNGQNIIFESNNNFELRLVSGASTGAVTMNILETGPLDLQIGANEGQFMEVRIQNLSPRALGITDMNLSTAEGAQKAITTVDDAITTVSSVRSKLGAYQNRLEYTISNLGTASENMTASLSRIQDADMAQEMSKFTQQNIIQQAGTSMLAQANQRPQSLLQLLQG